VAGPEGAPGSREPEMVGPFANYDDVMLAWIERAPLLLAGPCRRYRILAEGSAGLPARPPVG